MNEQAIRFRIGIFVLAALILLAVLITLFGGLPNYFKPSTSYTISFTNAPGVGPGTPVRRSGVKIGEVRRVQLDNATGKVEVLIQVDEGFQLRKGDRPTVLQTLLGGDASIAFLTPDQKEVDVTPVEPGAVLTGYNQPDASTLVQKTMEAVPTAEETLAEIKKAAQSLDKLFQNFDKLTPKADQTLTEFNKKILPKADQTLTEINRAAQSLNKIAPSIEKFAQTMDKMAPTLEETVREIRELAKSSRTLVPDIRKTLDETQVTARNWSKVGERVDLLIRTNEDKLIKTLDNLQEMVKRVGDVLSDENQKNIRDTLKNVKVSSDRFDSIARNSDDFIKEGRVTLKKVNDSFTRIDDVLVNIQKATKPIADRGESIVKNLDEGTDKLNKTMSDLRDILQVVARGDGTFQRLLSDPSLYNNVNDLACSVNKMMPRLEGIVRDFAVFADKLARHPELIGVRGAIAPSVGVK